MDGGPRTVTDLIALLSTLLSTLSRFAGYRGGLLPTVLIGLPNCTLNQSRNRCKAEISNSGQDWPHRAADHQRSPATLAKGRQPRRYLGLDILAKSRLTKITNENPTEEEVTITAITA